MINTTDTFDKYRTIPVLQPILVDQEAMTLYLLSSSFLSQKVLDKAPGSRSLYTAGNSYSHPHASSDVQLYIYKNKT